VIIAILRSSLTLDSIFSTLAIVQISLWTGIFGNTVGQIDIAYEFWIPKIKWLAFQGWRLHKPKRFTLQPLDKIVANVHGQFAKPASLFVRCSEITSCSIRNICSLLGDVHDTISKGQVCSFEDVGSHASRRIRIQNQSTCDTEPRPVERLGHFCIELGVYILLLRMREREASIRKRGRVTLTWLGAFHLSVALFGWKLTTWFQHYKAG